MQPVGMVLVLGFILFLFIEEPGGNPWEIGLVGFFLQVPCNMLFRYF